MQIDRKAPVTAEARSEIAAPAEVVWSVLNDIKGWPRWNPDVSHVVIDDVPRPGVEFRWRAGGAPIRSRIEDVKPNKRLTWTGRMLGIRAVHSWEFKSNCASTEVRTAESFEGVLVRLFPRRMRDMLRKSLGAGLGALKSEAERQAGAMALAEGGHQ